MPRVAKPKTANDNGRAFASQQSLANYIWDTYDLLRRSNCAGALQYVPERTWILFLRILDEREELEAAHAKAVGQPYSPSLAAPFRWRDWAAHGGHTKGGSTERIWYYDLSDVKVGKKTPLTRDRFADFFKLLPNRSDSERSWTVERKAIVAKNYDLKAVNLNAPDTTDRRTPAELLAIIDEKGRELEEALAVLRQDLSQQI